MTQKYPKPISDKFIEINVLRPRCQASASFLNGVRVDHDKGLYPSYCILEEGHSGPHKTSKVYWPNNETNAQKAKS